MQLLIASVRQTAVIRPKKKKKELNIFIFQQTNCYSNLTLISTFTSEVYSFLINGVNHGSETSKHLSMWLWLETLLESYNCLNVLFLYCCVMSKKLFNTDLETICGLFVSSENTTKFKKKKHQRIVQAVQKTFSVAPWLKNVELVGNKQNSLGNVFPVWGNAHLMLLSRISYEIISTVYLELVEEKSSMAFIFAHFRV